MATKLTQAQKDAVQWLRNHGGTGIILHTGKLLAGGETSAKEPVTWLHLVAHSMVDARVDLDGGATRITVTRKNEGSN